MEPKKQFDEEYGRAKQEGPAASVLPGIELPESLCARLEAAWAVGRDDAAVDRLAAAQPEHAEALYDFFALLIESELAAPPEQSEGKKSEERIMTWLAEEGFALANRIAREGATRTPQFTPTASAEVSARAQAAPLAYLGLLQERTGRGVDEVTGRMNLEASIIKFVQRQPADKFPRVRKEIVSRGARVWGVGEGEGEEALALPLPVAALRKTSAESLTFEQVVNRSGMNEEQKRFWLGLAAED